MILYEVEGCQGRKVAVCSDVYEPAEDTWMIARLLEGLGARRICVDVGTGTGVLATCLNCGYIVATDVNPCAVICAFRNLSSAAVDVVQCSGVSCLRPLADALVVFNAPYLPGPPRDNVEAAWAGGIRVIEDVLVSLSEWRGCWEAYVTVSSVTPLQEFERAASSLGLSYERLGCIHEDLFIDTFVYRVTPRRCAGHTRR